MITNILKVPIPFRNREVDRYYSDTMDRLNKVLVALIVGASLQDRTIIPATVLENSSYNKYLSFLLNQSRGTLMEYLDVLRRDGILDLYVNLQEDIELFILKKHIEGIPNYYSIDIDDKYMVTVRVRRPPWTVN